MKILHSYCLNYNIGDYALGIGLKNLMRNYLDVSLIGNTNIQGRVFNEYYIKEVVNKRYDLLVLGGGGIIHGAHWPNGWFWLINQELIKTIKIPFIVYGAGNNYWPEEGNIPNKAKKHLDETIRRAAFFSVRNDGSLDRLKEQIEKHDLIEIVPDPGFHVNLNTEYKRVVEEPYVLIQVANDKPEIRFGSEDHRKVFIKSFRELIKSLANRYKVIFSPHVIDDVELSYQIAKGIDNTEVWDFGYFAFDHSSEAIGYYKYAEYVISMRGHGQIVPISFGTPVITLGNHPKHKGLMNELNLLDYYIDISNKEFTEIIFEKARSLENNYFKIKSKYESINKMLLKDSEEAFKKIIEKLNNV